MRKKIQNSGLFMRALAKGATFILFIILVSRYDAEAQTYPFTLPSTLEATLNVKTESEILEEFNNLLLGYNIFGYTTEDERAFMRTMDPITVRFPHGLFANWYDWRDDGTRVFGTETFDYIHRGDQLKEATIGELSVIKTLDRINSKVGIEGLTTLNSEKKAANGGNGYDMLWTFNMSADGTDFTQSPETLARYQDLIARGFEVKAVELGNENFYPGQRSSIIPNAEEYILRAKNMSQTLKAQDPNIKVSIPLLRTGSFVNPSWNEDLTQDQSYYDAITVHTYIGANPDNPETSDEAYSTALAARDKLRSSTDDFVRIHTDKPIWLSEWGVKSGGPNAASVLGMLDCYLFMSENQDIYQRANWFSVNGVLNSFLVWENYVDGAGNTRPRIKQPYIKTANGSSYEILRMVFENSTMLDSDMDTHILDGNTKAVSGRAVTKDGETLAFVLNMTDQPANFTLQFNGKNYTSSFKHEALSFDSLSQESELPLDENLLLLIKEGTGQITLPPLSINVLSGLDSTGTAGEITSVEDFDRDSLNDKDKIVVYPNPSDNRIFTITTTGKWTVYNLSGRKVLEGKGEKVDLSGLSDGIYSLQTETSSHKLICN